MGFSDVNMFAVSAAVLYIKFLACTMIQGRKAFAAGTRLPEDSQLPQAKNAPKQGFADLTDDAVRTAVDEEMRWKRIVQNDLESMPMAYVVFWSAICVGVTGGITKALIFVYTVARVGHTIVYSQGLPRARMVCWVVGMGQQDGHQPSVGIAAGGSRPSCAEAQGQARIRQAWTPQLYALPHMDAPPAPAPLGCDFISQSPARASSRLNQLVNPRTMLGAITDVQTFGLAASLLYVKFLATSMMQARKSFAANTRMAEDKQLVCAMGLSGNMDDKQLKIALDNETRWRRIVQNDLESIPLAFLVFWGAIQNGVDPELTKTLMVVYTTARFGHTFAYGAGAAKSRMACWMSGTACILTAAANIAMNVFT